MRKFETRNNRSTRRRVGARKGVQRRAEDLKTLMEQRADLYKEMEDLANKAESEKRAMTEDEDHRFDELEKEIKALDTTINKLERARKLKNVAGGIDQEGGEDKKEIEKKETRAFENYIRSVAGGTQIEARAGEQNLTMGNNGAIIPATIANRIINTVKDICPVFARATMYHVNGTLKVPVWGLANSSHKITVNYQEEFTDITADSGKFTSIDLSGFLAGALVLIGKSVVNNAQVDVVSFIVGEMAREISAFLEGELLTGNNGKAQGALNSKNTVEAASGTEITADELISLQAKVKQVYQGDACWIMHPDTFVSIKKLKDGNNRYLLQDDFTGEFSYRLLGKPVYISDNMPKIGSGTRAVLYGDLSGLSVNMRENVQIQILQEKYATQHAVGVVAWFEFDSKVTDEQKLAVLTMHAG